MTEAHVSAWIFVQVSVGVRGIYSQYIRLKNGLGVSNGTLKLIEPLGLVPKTILKR